MCPGSERGSGLPASSAARLPIDLGCQCPGGMHACMYAGHARAGGSPGVRRRGPAFASSLFPASGTPACLRGARVVALPASALLPASGCDSSRAQSPALGPRPLQPQRRGSSPAQRSVCFSSPTDVSQNIGHMFNGNKLGMSANTLGLRWLFQLPHGRLEREGVSTFHPAVAPSPPNRGGISPWRPSELETRAHSPSLHSPPPLCPSVPGTR